MHNIFEMDKAKLKKPLASYRLIVAQDRLEFRQPLFVVFSGTLFLVFGIFCISLSIINPGRTHWIGMAIVFIMGVIFTFIGLKMLASINAVIAVFDRRRDSFSLRGHKPDNKEHASSDSSRITDIKSIELVPRSYWRAGGNSSGGMYSVIAAELVLNNGFRIKLLHYTDRQAALGDTRTLANFINKPLCDLMDMKPIDSTWGDRDPFGRQ